MKRHRPLSPELREADRMCDKYAACARLIAREHLRTDEDLHCDILNHVYDFGEKINILLFDKSFSLSTENLVILSIFDEYADLMLLAYLFSHRNRQINWDFNVSRSQDIINRVRSRDYEVVKDTSGPSTHHILDRLVLFDTIYTFCTVFTTCAVLYCL